MTAKYFPDMTKMTVKEVRNYLAQRRSIIVPLGIIEQHGYHLPLCTDAIIAERIAMSVGRRTGILVGPTLNMSYSGGQLPGTININPNVMSLLVGDVIHSLVSQGFQNLFLLPGHGGSENWVALENGLRYQLRDERRFAEAMVVLAPIWRFGDGWDEAIDDHDWHAGWLETSMVMALAPELVQMDALELDPPELLAQMREHPDNYQCTSKPADGGTVVPRIVQRPEINVAVMGHPELATVEKGREVVEDTVNKLSTHFESLERCRSQHYEPVKMETSPIILR